MAVLLLGERNRSILKSFYKLFPTFGNSVVAKLRVSEVLRETFTAHLFHLFDDILSQRFNRGLNIEWNGFSEQYHILFFQILQHLFHTPQTQGFQRMSEPEATAI
ncbi:unnamed protein product [Cochlearia groenlandica]